MHIKKWKTKFFLIEGTYFMHYAGLQKRPETNTKCVLIAVLWCLYCPSMPLSLITAVVAGLPMSPIFQCQLIIRCGR